jgi:hypothetical protein
MTWMRALPSAVIARKMVDGILVSFSVLFIDF